MNTKSKSCLFVPSSCLLLVLLLPLPAIAQPAPPTSPPFRLQSFYSYSNLDDICGIGLCSMTPGQLLNFQVKLAQGSTNDRQTVLYLYDWTSPDGNFRSAQDTSFQPLDSHVFDQSGIFRPAVRVRRSDGAVVDGHDINLIYVGTPDSNAVTPAGGTAETADHSANAPLLFAGFALGLAAAALLALGLSHIGLLTFHRRQPQPLT